MIEITYLHSDNSIVRWHTNTINIFPGIKYSIHTYIYTRINCSYYINTYIQLYLYNNTNDYFSSYITSKTIEGT